jgi:hypothetical protein
MNILKEVLSHTLLGTSEPFDEAEEQKRLSKKEEMPKKEVPKTEAKGASEIPQGKAAAREIPVSLGAPLEEKEIGYPVPEDQVLILEKSRLERAPIIEQVIRPRQFTEVQPVITREREQTEVHEVIQPIKEREILPISVEEKQLPTIEGEVIESDDQFRMAYEQVTEKLKSTVKVEDLQKERVINNPIVQEVVHKKVIEEIQPVIHKETVVPHVVKETQPIHERIVEAPKLMRGEYQREEAKEGFTVDVETLKRLPIFEETIKPKEITQIQPVITREREVTEVHEVLQPIKEREILPAVIEEKQLPGVEREEVRESIEGFEREYEELSKELKSTVEVENVQRERLVMEPIVQEIIHKRIVEEIQPVIHKETIVPHLIKEILPIHQRIIEAPKLFREELEERDLGTMVIGLSGETKGEESM